MMHHQKGHSLFEVLVALILLTTFNLLWVKQEIGLKMLLTQLLVRTSGMEFLDLIDELILVDSNQFPLPPSPYQLVIQRNSSQLQLELKSKPGFKHLIRHYTFKND